MSRTPVEITAEPRTAAPGGAARRGGLLAGAVAVAVGIALVEWWANGGWQFWLEDFHVYRLGAETILDGGPLYQVRTPDTQLFFTYPPIAALLFVPLTFGSPALAGIAWVAVEAFALELVCWLVLGAVGVRRTGARAGLTVLVSLAALLLDPVDADFSLGQINVLLMLVVLVDLVRGEGRGWQGIGIGLAAGIKLIPLFYIVYLVVTGRGRAAVRALAVFALTVVLGFLFVRTNAVDYWRSFGFSPDRAGPAQSVFNQSIRGTIARLAQGAPWSFSAWLAVAAVVAVVGLVLSARLYRLGHGLPAALVCAFTVALVSPVSWHHHWVWVVPFLIVGTAFAVRDRSPGWAMAVVFASAVFGLRLIRWFVPDDQALDPHLGFARELAADCMPIAGVVLITALAFLAWRRTPPLPSTDPSHARNRSATPTEIGPV